jgi:hypothetical protein
VFRTLPSFLLSMAYCSYFCMADAEFQQGTHRPSSASLSLADSSFRDHSTLKCLLETNLPHTQHQFFTSLSLKAVFEMGHWVVFSDAAAKARI